MLRARALEQALRMLRNECHAIMAMSYDAIKDSAGYTNLKVWIGRVEEADALLAVDPPPSGASPQAETRRDCTCLGTCRGAEGLGSRWKCALETSAPVSPVEPEPPTVECCACGHLNTPQQATRLEGEWRSSGEYVCLDSDACSRRIAKCSERPVEPEPCVWRADWREGRDGSILVPSCQPEMEIDAAFVQECVRLHGWKFCVHCGAPLKVEREP